MISHKNHAQTTHTYIVITTNTPRWPILDLGGILRNRNKFSKKHNLNIFSTVFQVGDINRVGRMPWPKTGAFNNHVQLGLLRLRSSNQRVVCPG